MQSFAQKQNQPPKAASPSVAGPNMAKSQPAKLGHSLLHLQHLIGNQAVLKMLQTRVEKPVVGLTGMASLFGHDFGRLPLYPPAAGAIQTKLAISNPGDLSEQEADRIADQVLAMPAPPSVTGAPPRIQRLVGQPTGQMHAALLSVDQVLASPGSPLEPTLRQEMEQRFGYDFSQVRVYSGVAAGQSAQEMNAHAYTVGHNIVFGAGRFAPGTQEGRRLIAHELTHVVQQSGSDGIRVDSSNEKPGLSPISLEKMPRKAPEASSPS